MSEVIKSNKGNAGKGRPPKKEIIVPVFRDDSEIRKYLFNKCFILMENINTKAMKDNNIKSPEIARAKNQQFKLAIDSIKLVNNLLKDKQLDDLNNKINLLDNAKVMSLNSSESKKDTTDDDKLLNTIKLLEELKL